MSESAFQIFVNALLANNFVLAMFLGLCPILGVSGKLDTALPMGIATTFVMLVASLCAYGLNLLLAQFHLEFLRLISYIVIIASAVQLVEMVLKKYSPALFRALGIYLPLITTNCAVLGVALFQTAREYDLVQSVVFSIGGGAGFTLALVLMASVRERLQLSTVPEVAQGTALSLMLAGILSLSFMGLGDPRFTVDERVGKLGQPRTYTITVQQVPGVSNSVWLTNTLSPWLVPDLSSVTGGALYNPATRQLTWAGTLPGGGSHTITYRATPTGVLPYGFKIENALVLHDGNHTLTFDRLANMWVEAPDVVARITAVPNQPLGATVFTYSVTLENRGTTTAPNVATMISLPNTFYVVTDTLATSDGVPYFWDVRLYWWSELDVAEAITLTLVLTREATAVAQWVAATALVDDDLTSPTFFAQWEYVPVYSRYFPIVFHQAPP